MLLGSGSVPVSILIKYFFIISWARDGIRTRDPNLGKGVLYKLSYSRICDYSLGSFVTINVNGVIKPTNITGLGFHCKTITKNRQFLTPKTE